MKNLKWILLLVAACFTFIANITAQITVTSADMPSVGDTFRISTALTTAGVDPELTGTDYTWDYTGLTSVSQTLDSFVSVGSTNILYQLVFNNPFDPEKATIAVARGNIDFIPGFEVLDVFEYFRETNNYYAFSGFAGNVMGIPLPVKYDDPDIIYSFPMNYNNIDSSDTEMEMSLAGLGYIFSHRIRDNHVDGWGTLKTPYGTFDALRVKSMVTEYDSAYIDSLGGGLGITRNYTEYRWVGKNFGRPLLMITVEGLLTTINYIDSTRSVVSAINDNISPLAQLNVYPNPVADILNLEFNLKTSESVHYNIFSIDGRQLYSSPIYNMTPGKIVLNFDTKSLNLPGGVYFVQLHAGSHQSGMKFLIE